MLHRKMQLSNEHVVSRIISKQFCYEAWNKLIERTSVKNPYLYFSRVLVPQLLYSLVCLDFVGKSKPLQPVSLVLIGHTAISVNVF